MHGIASYNSSSRKADVKPRVMQSGHVHAGYIKLQLPVFHIGYFKNTLQILQVRADACTAVAFHAQVLLLGL